MRVAGCGRRGPARSHPCAAADPVPPPAHHLPSGLRVRLPLGGFTLELGGGGGGPARPAPSGPRPASGDALPPRDVAAVVAAVRADREAVALLAAGGEPLDAHLARRWLQSRQGDVGAATAALRAHARWRGAAFPAGRVLECEIEALLATRKVCLQGLDAAGRPVILIRARLHFGGDAAGNRRLICYALDAAYAAAAAAPASTGNPDRRVLCLFDLAGVRPANLDARALGGIFDTLKRSYPERLSALYFLVGDWFGGAEAGAPAPPALRRSPLVPPHRSHQNAPAIFGPLWSLVSPMVLENVRRKIRFLRGDAARAVLAETLPPHVWPTTLGGTAPLIPVDEAVAAARAAAGKRPRRRAFRAAARAAAPSTTLAAVLVVALTMAVSVLAGALRWALWGPGGGRTKGRERALDGACAPPALAKPPRPPPRASSPVAWRPPPTVGLDLLFEGGLAPL